MQTLEEECKFSFRRKYIFMHLNMIQNIVLITITHTYYYFIQSIPDLCIKPHVCLSLSRHFFDAVPGHTLLLSPQTYNNSC